jgi:hypothetical protein
MYVCINIYMVVSVCVYLYTYLRNREKTCSHRMSGSIKHESLISITTIRNDNIEKNYKKLSRTETREINMNLDNNYTI